MSSPNEPGQPRAGEGSSAPNGATGSGPGHDGGSVGSSVTRSGAPAHSTESSTDVPPWQRGPAARRPPTPPEGEAPRPGAPSGLDARLNRFISGGSAAEKEPEPGPRGDRTEVVRTDPPRPEPPRGEPGPRPDGPRPEPGAYGSELPDLSGPRPPQPPRKPVERPAGEQPGAKPPVKAALPQRAVQVATRQPHKGPVRASMQIRRIDPWSALKVSLVLSVALFFVWMIAVAFLYLVLGGMGVWSKLNSNVGDLLTSASGTSGGELVSSGTIFGGAALIGLVNIVLLTAAATIGAFIYNLTTDLVGGVEVTLADRD
ncbi:DUF3566 domain-containing protein [Mycolicibacterium sp.]|uniref:DUF3566 domain-containing protein n=1 Tax=Mycolicibacterium sp. TaxID=2320850 RepID=UPI003D0D4269